MLDYVKEAMRRITNNNARNGGLRKEEGNTKTSGKPGAPCGRLGLLPEGRFAIHRHGVCARTQY